MTKRDGDETGFEAALKAHLEERAPRSRRERPAKAALSKDAILDKTVEIMFREGLGKVTMRRLAQELDTGPASLYVYVRNVADLHAALLDELLGRIDDEPAAGDWRARLEALLVRCTTILFEHPELARSAISTRPSGEHYLTLIERLLTLLDEGGVPPGQAAWGVDMLLQFVTATAAEQSTRDESGRAERDWDELTLALHGVSPDRHPRVAALAPDLISGTPQERLTWGLRAVLNGILHTPVPVTVTPSAGRDRTTERNQS
ncbi:TetR/AcrR family transcriptional regulator [Actinokineospora enzanensis]|uniref:TetR/AcrR family transcriptional regulator n=1 Tax=Actinokineospora enzanensis TaxID=155975 RepID=UPI0003787B64|nr:TetR/AcrR family transcriptional regulator C-terminal domain-containing protein [Actinokineospora enzanensis]